MHPVKEALMLLLGEMAKHSSPQVADKAAQLRDEIAALDEPRDEAADSDASDAEPAADAAGNAADPDHHRADDDGMPATEESKPE